MIPDREKDEQIDGDDYEMVCNGGGGDSIVVMKEGTNLFTYLGSLPMKDTYSFSPPSQNRN